METKMLDHIFLFLKIKKKATSERRTGVLKMHVPLIAANCKLARVTFFLLHP
jgi:hypothetical protein